MIIGKETAVKHETKLFIMENDHDYAIPNARIEVVSK